LQGVIRFLQEGNNMSVIEKMQEIVANEQAAKINGVLVDLFTASAVVQIYDQVSDANKAKMQDMSAEKLANVAYKLMGAA